MTDSPDLCQLEGRALKWQLSYFGPKVGYFVHIFHSILTFLFFNCLFFQDKLCRFLVFWPHFFSEVSHRQHCAH